MTLGEWENYDGYSIAGDRLVLFAEDEWPDDLKCPSCGTPWDQDEWEVIAHGGDAWGGQAVHECPKDGCDGTASVNY